MTSDDGATPGGDAVRIRLARLAGQLTEQGDLRSGPWRQAFSATPRHVFLPRFYRQENPPRADWTPVSRESLGERLWLDLVYSDTSWVTQVDGSEDLWSPSPSTLTGTNTSSSTMPGIVFRMLEDLDVRDGDRVLEIGTGTGYSTALLCHRLGADRVTSVEYDSQVARRAAAALASLGHHPILIVGDGEDGYPDASPYDRIIATCSFTHVPLSWIEQAAPGARISVPLSGSLHGGAHVILTVHGDGSASGFLSDRPLFFMLSRPQVTRRLPPFVHPKRDDSRERKSDVAPTLFDDWTFRFLLQIRIPNLTVSGRLGTGNQGATFRTPDPDRWAVARVGDDGRLRVRDDHPDPLWPTVEDTAYLWDALGRPGHDRFLLVVTSDEQTLSIPGTRLRWRLPHSKRRIRQEP